MAQLPLSLFLFFEGYHAKALLLKKGGNMYNSTIPYYIYETTLNKDPLFLSILNTVFTLCYLYLSKEEDNLSKNDDTDEQRISDEAGVIQSLRFSRAVFWIYFFVYVKFFYSALLGSKYVYNSNIHLSENEVKYMYICRCFVMYHLCRTSKHLKRNISYWLGCAFLYMYINMYFIGTLLHNEVDVNVREKLAILVAAFYFCELLLVIGHIGDLSFSSSMTLLHSRLVFICLSNIHSQLISSHPI